MSNLGENCMEECMDCVQAAARLHLYIDRELNIEEITIVQQHLTDCPHCECRFHFDRRIKRLIHERCTIEQAPEHLRIAVMHLAHFPLDGSHPIDPHVEWELRADMRESELGN